MSVAIVVVAVAVVAVAAHAFRQAESAELLLGQPKLHKETLSL